MRRRTLESVLLHTQHRGRGRRERKGGRVQDVSHLRILCAGQCGEPQPAVAKSGNLVSACLSLVRSLGVDHRPAFREVLGHLHIPSGGPRPGPRRGRPAAAAGKESRRQLVVLCKVLEVVAGQEPVA